MSSRRKPYDPLLSKLLVTTEDETASTLIKEIKNCINDCTEDCIEESKTALQSAKKWEEGITDGFARLTRNVDKVLADNEIITKPPSDFLTSKKGKKLRSIAERVVADASKVSNVFQTSATTSNTSLPSEDELKESTVHEEELQLKAEEITAEDPGMPFLQVSYDDLEPLLKDCLLYFSAFPKDTVIKRRVMIYWWIGERLVTPTRDGRTAEQVGKDYFKMLIASGLIEPIYQKHSKSAKYCKIYTWVWKMLVSKAKESGFFAFDPEGRLTFDSSKSKRACLVEMKEKDQVEISPESNTNGLQSIFNLSVQYLHCDKGKDQLAKLKNVSALQLGRWQNSSCHHIEVSDTEFLEGLESLKELRYLNLQGISRITELPETIRGLTNLLILDLRLCHNLENVTPAVTYIKSLTHLDVSECYLLDKMPPGIGSLTNLQVLKGFVVGGIRSTNPCKLRELTQLKELRKLSIRVGSDADIGKDLYELSKIERLRSLKITWGSIKSPPSKNTERKKSSVSKSIERKTSSVGRSIVNSLTRHQEPVAQAFSHGNLEKLVLECVPGDESVSWLKPNEFMGLKRLYIAGGKLTQLSTLTENDGWNVEILRLKFLKELKLEWVDLKRKLRQLLCAQIYKCPQIKSSLLDFDKKGFWVRNEKEASSSSVAGTSASVRMKIEEEASSSSIATSNTAPVRMRNEEEASSSSMAATSASVRLKIEEEASSSSIATTSAPIRMRNEEEASSSSIATTSAPVRMKNEEASSSSIATTSAPVRMRNEEALSSSSIANTSALVRMKNEEEASSSSIATTSAPVRMRNEEAVSSSSIATTSALVRMKNKEEASSSSIATTSAPVRMKNEEASSSSIATTSAPVRMRNEEALSSSSIANTSALVRMKNEEEASSSSIATTSAPVRMRNEEAVSSSSIATTSALVRMKNKEEASSSSIATTSAPVRMKNEEEASSSSIATASAPVRMRNEEEASSSSMAATSAPVRMRNEEEARSSSIAATC